MVAKGQKYALVTGAASGMGRAYARALAAKGYGVVAVDCSAEALQRLHDELTARDVSCVAICLDLAHPKAAEEVLRRVEEQACMIEVLICNAGVLAFGGFAALTQARVEQVMALHMTTHTKLVHTLGAQMCSRGCGYILWVSSTTAWLPYPSIALYAATKRYIKTLSEALHDEWAHCGVAVTVVLPGAVDTPFYRLDAGLRSRLLWWGVLLSPEEVTRRALRALFRGRKRVIPGWAAKLMVLMGRMTPSWVIRRVVRLKRVERLLS